MKEESEKGS